MYLQQCREVILNFSNNFTKFYSDRNLCVKFQKKYKSANKKLSDSKLNDSKIASQKNADVTLHLITSEIRNDLQRSAISYF